MAPKDPLTVSRWAERHAGYDPLVRPWQSEIMDALGDAETAEVGLMGPAQIGKSEIGLGWIGWGIDHDPADMLMCQPDRAMAQDFVVRRIEPMVARTQVLRDALLPVANADNIFLKRFRGSLLTTIWPVPAQFRARPVPRGWIDDYDQIEGDIGATEKSAGQGDAIGLLDARQSTFKGRDTKFVSSSPADDEGGKIEAFVDSGSDERLHPVCPSCGERFAIDLKEQLDFTRGEPALAAETVHLTCPVNGCVLGADAQQPLIDSLAALPNRGWIARRPERGRRRRTFRVDGLMGFRSWGNIAEQWRQAELAWEARGDEGPLRSFWQTVAGYNYRSKISGEKPIDTADLAGRREKGWKSGTVPPGCKVLFTIVDLQADRFECATLGWGDGLECWLVKRWGIHVLADGITPVSPFQRPEDWKALLPLFDRAWPTADGSGSVKPLGLVVDTGGLDKATDAAKAFWHAVVALGVPKTRLTLVKGGRNPNAPLMSRAQFSDQRLKGGPRRNSPELWMPNVHAIKNILDARLRRQAPGPLYIHLPGDLAEEHVAEITAEELKKGKWEKVRPRNETLDHLVYGYAALLRPPFAQSRTHMRWVPAAFRVPDQLPLAPKPGPTEPEITAETPPKPAEAAAKPADRPKLPPKSTAPRPVPARTGKPWIGAGAGWLGRKR